MIAIPLDDSGKLPSDFKTPVLAQYGIYVIKHDGHVIRIGESSSGFSRIANGFKKPLRHMLRGKDRKNYIAYSWREEYRSQTLRLDYFPLLENAFSDAHLRRALEAEVTFQFRLARSAWPRNMSEIHFLERYRTHDVLVAKAIEIMRQYNHAYNAAV